MAAHLTHRHGEMEDYAPEKIAALIAELEVDDDHEHPDVSVSHEDGWTLSAFPGGLVVWENVEDGAAGPRHLRDVPAEQLASMFVLCAEGRREVIDSLPWLEGYDAAVNVPELMAVLAEVRELLARPGNDYAWSSFARAEAALAEIDELATQARVEGEVPFMLKVLFAATGPIQEVAISSGWGDEFIELAERFDVAIGEASP